MDRLTQYTKRIYEKIKALSMSKKIIYGGMVLGVLVALIIFIAYQSSTKYGLLWNNLSAQDNKTITDKLTAKKETYKIIGTGIYVPKADVDSLRLELDSSLSGGSSGYELFDTSPTLGMTQDEFNIEKLRANQGELEKTIKSFPQVENVRVHLALPEDTAFVTTDKPGKVAVYLTLKPGMTLDVKQVKAIIALVSNSIDNVPKENVDIIDQNLTLLSQNIFNSEGDDSSVSIDDQQVVETKFESKLENAIREILDPPLGENKVHVKVNVAMNFDSKEKTVITYDPNKVIVSGHYVAEGNLGTVGSYTQSPVDNNMSNFTITTGAGVSTGVNKIDNTVNFNVGSSQEKTLNAPGEITRVTASVMYDGTLDNTTKTQIESAVANAIGFNAARNDAISVVGIVFDPAKKKADQAAIDALKAQTAKAAQTAALKLYAMIGAGIVVLLIFGVIMLLKRRKKRKVQHKGIDVVVGDPLFPNDESAYVPLNLNVENATESLENDIKKYAEEKPDQVVDIIKSWLAEDER